MSSWRSPQHDAVRLWCAVIPLEITWLQVIKLPPSGTEQTEQLWILKILIASRWAFGMLSSWSVSSQRGSTAFHRQGSWTAETSPSCYSTSTIIYSVCIHDRLHCVLFKAVDLAEALLMPLSITELCLWFLTLPEGLVTNGPTCDAFCVKVTTAITLEGRAHVVNSSGVFVPCAVVLFAVLCGPAWSLSVLYCADLTMLIQCL